MSLPLRRSEDRLEFQWSQLPPLPDAAGLGGAFAGVSEGQLVVAGGTNFPGAPLWQGGRKAWHDTVYGLVSAGSAWQVLGRLPRPLAYGVSVSIPQGLLCAGGSDAQTHYPDVFRLHAGKTALTLEALPPLPRPLAYGCGALVGRVVYVAGGLETPAASQSLRNFWALELDAKPGRWRELEPWPGPARMLSVAAARAGAFYLFSGCELAPSAEGKPVRRYLTDAYRYRPEDGWTTLAALPRPVVAAPSPAAVTDAAFLAVLGADDGSRAGFQPLEAHPGFPKGLFIYDTDADRWWQADGVPVACATTPLVQWNGRFVVPSGEVRPGVRSPQVWTFTPARQASL